MKSISSPYITLFSSFILVSGEEEEKIEYFLRVRFKMLLQNICLNIGLFLSSFCVKWRKVLAKLFLCFEYKHFLSRIKERFP